MPKTTGRKVLIKTLTKIMENPEATIHDQLEACRILAGISIRKPKESAIKLKPSSHKSKSTLLG